MRSKHLLLIALFLAPFMLNADNLAANNNIQLFAEGGPCEYAAPTNFHVTAMGSIWVSYAWDAPTTPRPHRIKVYRSSDGALLSTTNVPAGIQVATIAVPVATETDAEIRAVCTNGEGGAPSFVHCPGIILDLIVKGYSPSFVAPSCTLNTSNSLCCFPTSGTTTFRIRQVSNYANYRDFTIEKVLGANHFIVRTSGNSPGQYYWILCDYNHPSYLVGYEYEIRSKSSEGDYARFEVSYDDNSGCELKLKYINSDYEIFRVTPCGGGEKPEWASATPREQRADQYSALEAVVSPNPFSDGFEVYVNAPAQQVSLQLFNLSGQKVFDQLFEGGQEQYSVPSVGLTPGFYLLRVEADGAVQTLKVVKSE